MTTPWDRIRLMQGDITTLAVDAIVNAANSTLLGGGGVDGAIHRAAGPELLAECHTLGGCRTGEAKITRGYRLPARHVIHTVGPIYIDGRSGEPEELRACHINSLNLAVRHSVRTIAFPAISCGAYRYPPADAARVALGAIAQVLEREPAIAQVTMVLFANDLLRVFEQVEKELRQPKT